MTGAAKTLDDAENLYAARDLEKAKETYLAVLQQTDLKKMHAAAYYGLARIAALQKDPESSQRLFLRTLELDPEPPVKAWTLVYLGKLSLASSEQDEAVKYFQQAVSVEGALRSSASPKPNDLYNRFRNNKELVRMTRTILAGFGPDCDRRRVPPGPGEKGLEGRSRCLQRAWSTLPRAATTTRRLKPPTS